MNKTAKDRDRAIRDSMVDMFRQFLGSDAKPPAGTIRVHVCPWRVDPTGVRDVGAVAICELPEMPARFNALCDDWLLMADSVLRARGITPDTDVGAGITITIDLHPSNLDASSTGCTS